MNQTKTVFDPFIFNTAITRSKSLVVAVGNPFLILHIEKQMEMVYGDRAKCWSQFMKQCLECDTFHFSNQAKNSMSNREFGECRAYLHSELFGKFKTRIEVDSSEKQGDSILRAYQKELEKIFEYRNTKLILSRVSRADLTWIMNDQDSQGAESQVLEEEIQDDKEEKDYVEKYDCILNFHSYREAEAVPIDHRKKVVTIRGSGNRIGAFDGDTFEVGVFRDNPDGKCYGRALKLRARGGQATFICRVSHHNPVVFYPIDKKNPKFINLPRMSRDLLLRRDKDAVKDELKSTDVVVFDPHAVEHDSEELKIPPINQVIPHAVAKEMLFIVAYLRWKEPYRVPLGIVIGALPKGYTAFSAERLLKIKHNIVYDDDRAMEPSADAKRGPDSGPLYDRAFTIDPDDAQNLDDAVSLVKVPHDDDSVDTYQLGVHIVNCAKHIEPNEDIDREARQRGTSVYGGKEGKIMQMLPVQTREMLSLKPNKIRDVLSVIASVVIDCDGISIADIEIKQAQIKSCVQMTYMDAQKIMNGVEVFSLALATQEFNRQEDQPSLSMTLQLLYKIAHSLKKKRLQSNAAYCHDLNEPEDSRCWQAHMLVEELMIWANSTVAERVHRFYPDVALLRRQPLPNLEIMNAFIDQHKQVASLSLGLSYLVSQQERAENLSLVVTIKTLSLIREAISAKDFVLLSSLLFSDRYYPQIAAVHSQLRSNLPRAEYCCTDRSTDSSHYQHYSLRLDHYTHFSSPLRRYLDIEVQRMLMQLPEVSNVSGPPKEFLHSEHQNLCSKLNKKVRNASQFGRSITSIDLAVKYGSSSEVYDAFIAEVAKGSVELCFPQLELKDIPQRERRIPLKFLGPYANVREEELVSTLDKPEYANFRWKMQMTSFSADQGVFVFKVPRLHIQKEDKAGEDGFSVEMFTTNTADPDKSTLTVVKYRATTSPATVTIPFDQWKKALDFVKDPTTNKMKELEAILPSLPAFSPMKEPEFEASKCSPFINYRYQTSFKSHNVIRVWMTRCAREALITPSIQIVEVDPLVRICIQHNTHPAECFSDQNLSKASRRCYSNITEYVHLWERVLLAEAAEKSVKECRQIIVHDVQLEWPELYIPSNCIDEEYYQPNGSISLILPQNYVENCSEFIHFNEGDLVCVRYGTDPHAEARAVFHMVIHKVICSTDDETLPAKVLMKFVGESSCRISEKMKAILRSKCELQLISLSTSYQ